MKKITLECNQVRYAEFPELKYAKSEDDIVYCDIDAYLQDRELSETHNITEFQKKFFFFLTKAAIAYELDIESVIVIDEISGHHLLVCELALLFIMYTDPDFMFYVLDRADEMLLNGIAVSDTALKELTNIRFPN